jgi:Tol biopolymer transport system component
MAAVTAARGMPAGMAIVFVLAIVGSTNTSGIDASIYTRTMSGSVHRLTHAKTAFDSNPVWSPTDPGSCSTAW